MNRMTKTAIALGLIKQLRGQDSWCGETHLQKSMYFLEALAEVPMDLGFILYKHGPYSFDFHEMIRDMKSSGLIEYKYIPPYGPRIGLSERGDDFLDAHASDVEQWGDQVATVAKCLGDKKVVELEKLGTALLVYREDQELAAKKRIKRLCELKPHIDEDEARQATREFDKEIKPCFQ